MVQVAVGVPLSEPPPRLNAAVPPGIELFQLTFRPSMAASTSRPELHGPGSVMVIRPAARAEDSVSCAPSLYGTRRTRLTVRRWRCRCCPAPPPPPVSGGVEVRVDVVRWWRCGSTSSGGRGAGRGAAGLAIWSRLAVEHDVGAAPKKFSRLRRSGPSASR